MSNVVRPKKFKTDTSHPAPKSEPDYFIGVFCMGIGTGGFVTAFSFLGVDNMLAIILMVLCLVIGILGYHTWKDAL